MSVRGSGKHYVHKVNQFDHDADCTVELGWFRFFSAQFDVNCSVSRSYIPVTSHAYPKMSNCHAQSSWMSKFFKTMNSQVKLVKE